MIFIDERVGSKDLLKPLHEAGFEADTLHLDFGDVGFVGKGAQGAHLNIGIELKTLNDLVGSIRSGRLAGHQLPGLRATFDHSWLVVEGLWRTNDGGQVVTYQGKTRGWIPLHGKMTASELEKHVLTLEMCGGLHVRYTNTRKDTIRFIGTLYRWFTDRALDEHTSHIAVSTAPTLVPLSPFRAAVCQWPGVGIKFSAAVETYFRGSIQRAAAAPVDEWANITLFDGDGKSRRLGNAAALKIVKFCEGE